MKEQFKISIITVSFNAVTTIEKTILSVINQTYDNIEYIIIDGGSTDGTIDIIRKYSDNIAYWISEPDKGIYDAMNKGAAIASGKYIQYLNSSDRINNDNTIENIVKEILTKKSDIYYGDIIIEKKFGIYHFKPDSLEKFKYSFPIYHPSTWIKREIMLQEKFETSYKIAADFNLFRGLFYKNRSFTYLPIIFTKFEGYDGISSTSVYNNWVECQIITNKNKQKFWSFYKSLFYIKDKLRLLIYNFFNCFDSDFQNRREHSFFIKDIRLAEIIEDKYK